METALHEAEALEKDIRISARPETVFSFLVDPAKMTRWIGINVTLDPKPGGIYRVDVDGSHIARGEYVEVTPYSRVVFTFGWEGDDSPLQPGSSTVEITLTPDGDATVLRLRHSGLDAEQRKFHAEGWDHFVPRLGIVAEGNDPGADPWAANSDGHS